MITLTELLHTINELPGVSKIQKMGARSAAFRVDGVQHSAYITPDGGLVVLFREGNHVARMNRAEDLAAQFQKETA